MPVNKYYNRQKGDYGDFYDIDGDTVISLIAQVVFVHLAAPSSSSRKAGSLGSFACPKETNQRKGQPQIFFGSTIL
jgi:hypothetical protein